MPSPSREQPPPNRTPEPAQAAQNHPATSNHEESSLAGRRDDNHYGTGNPNETDQKGSTAEGSSARAERQGEEREETGDRKTENAEESAKKERERKNAAKKPREQYSCVECFR